MLLPLLLLGCLVDAPSSTTTPPPAVDPEPMASADTPVRFVTASSLNLREEPGGDKLGTLEINSPLTVLEQRGDHARVRVANGKEGWVAASFLGEEPLTVAAALEERIRATTPESRLAWSQRAAAIDVRNRDALQALADSYAETGDTRTSAQLARRLAWPDDLLLAGAHGPVVDGVVRVEWGDIGVDDGGGGGIPVPLKPEQLEKAGLQSGQDVWLLPFDGPAVQGSLQGAQRRVFNSCGGTYGVVLEVAVDLPDTTEIAAWTLKRPPASWSRPAPQPTAADRRALQDHIGTLPEEASVHTVAADGGLFARVARPAEPDALEDDITEWILQDYRVERGVVREVGGDRYHSFIGYELPATGRDIDGDDQLDVVWTGLCAQMLQDHEGVVRAQTATTCCGC